MGAGRHSGCSGISRKAYRQSSAPVDGATTMLLRPGARRRAVRVAIALLDDLELLQPAHEEMSRGVGLLLGLRALERVQHLIALIDARARFVLAHEQGGVFDIA